MSCPSFLAHNTLTNDKGIKLTMKALGKVIEGARDLQKRFKNDLERFKSITLDRWVEQIDLEKK